MIKGLEQFKVFFREFQDQYVLIGGAACDIVLSESNLSFRATKDLDMVLLVEALTPEFGRKFWDFISAGGYENRVKSNGKPQFYRFDKPKAPDYPYMIELFSRAEPLFDSDIYVCRPLNMGDEISSLSAILLNNDYYDLLQTGKIVLADAPVLQTTHLILFKAKAWLDLSDRKAAGQMIDEKDIRKHKNDVARLAVILTGNERCKIPENIKSDMQRFVTAFENDPPDIRSLGIVGVSADDIVDVLKSVYAV